MVIVSDTSPLINLAIVDRLDLIPRLFKSVVLPQAVFDEIVVSGAGLPGADEIREADWISVRICQNQTLVLELLESLDRGEAEAIALALEIQADTILMDEDLGRKIALQYHLNPLGILGILLKAKKEGMVPAIKPIMDRLLSEAHFFIHRKLYEDVLKMAQEESR